jgi:pimeloyl-ACP methyl ester carboxylesterase
MISGGFDKSGEAMPDMEFDIDQMTAFLGATYGEVSPDGEAHFPVVARKIADMAKREPHLDITELSKVTCRSLAMFSDDDLVTPQHMIDMYAALPDAELAIVPGTSHFLTQEKPDLVNTIVVDFLTKKPAATVAPVRRAGRLNASPG